MPRVPEWELDSAGAPLDRGELTTMTTPEALKQLLDLRDWLEDKIDEPLAVDVVLQRDIDAIGVILSVLGPFLT